MALGRMYRATFSKVAVTAAQDLFEVNAPSDSVVIIHGFKISQSSDVGDAQEEILNLLMKKGATTSGSGGTTPTASPNQTGTPAYGGTVEANNTTKATSGSIITNGSDGPNVRIGKDVIFTPEDRIVLSPSERFTLELVDAPADSLTVSGEITFEELGG
jgi:hypothetical protein